MTSYVVMTQPGASDEDTVLVRDSFAPLAFIAPVLWFAWHRMWLEAFVCLAATIALTALGGWAGFGAAAPFLSFLVSLYAGLEGPALRIAALGRRGMDLAGIIDAASRHEAELRWFHDPAVPDGTGQIVQAPAASLPRRSAAGQDGIGLVSFAGE